MPMGGRSIRVMVVDDTDHVRHMLRSMLTLDGFEVVEEAAGGQQAVQRIGDADPDELATMGERISLRYGDQVRTAVRVQSYAELGPGQIGLVVDSYGLIAVSLDKRSAAEELRLHAPVEVTLEPAPDR